MLASRKILKSSKYKFLRDADRMSHFTTNTYSETGMYLNLFYITAACLHIHWSACSQWQPIILTRWPQVWHMAYVHRRQAHCTNISSTKGQYIVMWSVPGVPVHCPGRGGHQVPHKNCTNKGFLHPLKWFIQTNVKDNIMICHSCQHLGYSNFKSNATCMQVVCLIPTISQQGTPRTGSYGVPVWGNIKPRSLPWQSNTLTSCLPPPQKNPLETNLL